MEMYFDIETVREVDDFYELSERKRLLFQKKFRHRWETFTERWEVMTEATAQEFWRKLWKNEAAFLAEFCKIVCVSVGIVTVVKETTIPELRVKAFCSLSETKVLNDFIELLEKQTGIDRIIGQNIKAFDMPILMRRIIINRLPLPKILDIMGKKPWDLKWVDDTMDMWQGGDIKHHASLDLLCEVLEIDSPKSDIDGSMVGDIYWAKDGLPFDKEERIGTYCNGDVIAECHVHRKMLYRKPIAKENIKFVA
jgi:DNA polymerase elongation subunit (family B)